MSPLPQRGRCLCGDVVYRVDAEPVSLYACHCTDCQRETGSCCSIAMLVASNAFELERGEVREHRTELPDGRRKGGFACARCRVRLWTRSRIESLRIIEAGTLDDTRWLRPAAHIWTRSAQPWLVLEPAVLRFEQQPSDEEQLAIVRAWRQRVPARA